MATKMLGALKSLGTERAMVFHGDDGLDELTTTTTSTVHELVDGSIESRTIDPKEFGLGRADPSQLVGGDALSNARAVHAVLAGESGPHRDIALLNAAAALLVAGSSRDFGAALDAARSSVDDGAAARALDTLVRVSGDAKAAEPS
jgi:anthranilate phosphoribosyltransferase